MELIDAKAFLAEIDARGVREESDPIELETEPDWHALPLTSAFSAGILEELEEAV
mgnify:FL=1